MRTRLLVCLLPILLCGCSGHGESAACKAAVNAGVNGQTALLLDTQVGHDAPTLQRNLSDAAAAMEAVRQRTDDMDRVGEALDVARDDAFAGRPTEFSQGVLDAAVATLKQSCHVKAS